MIYNIVRISLKEHTGNLIIVNLWIDWKCLKWFKKEVNLMKIGPTSCKNNIKKKNATAQLILGNMIK